MKDTEFYKQLELLVKGDLDPEQWISWWTLNDTKIQSFCNAGQRLRLKPMISNNSATRAALGSQNEAQAILKTVGINVAQSTRYKDAWKTEFENYLKEEAEQRARKAEAISKSLPKLNAFCPVFSKYLKRNIEDIEAYDPGVDDIVITELEERLGSSLPSSVREFFKLCSRLELDGLRISLRDLFLHPVDDSCYLSIGEYWFEADGDQLLVSTGGSDEIYYYGHESIAPKVRPIAASLWHFLDQLPSQVG